MQQLEHARDFAQRKIITTVGNPEWRRRIAAETLDRPSLFPHEILAIHDNALENAIDHLQNGTGLVVYFNHFSMRDPAEVLKDLVLIAPDLLSYDIAGPLAYHQTYPGLLPLAQSFDISLKPVVTSDTEKKHKDYTRPTVGQRAQIVYDALHQTVREKKVQKLQLRRRLRKDEKHTLALDYLETAGETLKSGNIVIIAPETGRRDRLTPFPKRPLGMLVDSAVTQGVEKIAFLPISVIDLDSNEYKVSGFNRKHRYGLTIGACLTLDDILDVAEEGSDQPLSPRQRFNVVDKVLYNRLRDLFPADHPALQRS